MLGLIRGLRWVIIFLLWPHRVEYAEQVGQTPNASYCFQCI
jgi:hypothetical protein